MLLFLLAPLLAPPPTRDHDGPVHIEKACGDLEAPLTPVTMQCGASCVIDEKGNVIPDEFEWVFPPAARDATCRACRAAVGLPAEG